MNKSFIILLATFLCVHVHAQQAYFVDGYHGGIYGHYPVKWKTQFIVDQLSNHPEWRICLEIEPETWDTVQVQTPDAYRQLKKVVNSDRWNLPILLMHSLIAIISRERASYGSFNMV